MTPRKILTYVLLIFFSVMILIPFAYLLCSSLKSPADFFSSLFLLLLTFPLSHPVLHRSSFSPSLSSNLT